MSDQDERPRIPPGQVVTRKFPVMTAGTPKVTPQEKWTLTVDGKVETPLELTWSEFSKLPTQEFTVDIHCVTKWSKLDTVWRGVSLDVLIDLVKPAPDARYLSAVSDGDYSANLRTEDLIGGKAFVATHFDGQPLSEEHGGPARLVVPGLYFWKSAKWLRRLTFSEYDYKGFWEKLGYHNYGDPWKEQRFRG